jgi:hypothetical protein
MVIIPRKELIEMERTIGHLNSAIVGIQRRLKGLTR